MHLLGAGLLFGGGSAYTLAVTYITYKYLGHSRIRITRLVLTFISVSSFLLRKSVLNNISIDLRKVNLNFC